MSFGMKGNEKKLTRLRRLSDEASLGAMSHMSRYAAHRQHLPPEPSHVFGDLATSSAAFMGESGESAESSLDELFNLTSDLDLLNRIKSTALIGDNETLEEYAELFAEHVDHVHEIAVRLSRLSDSDPLQIRSKNLEMCIPVYGPQVVAAAQSLSLYPSSKICKENLEVFSDMWLELFNDVATLAKDLVGSACPGSEFHLPYFVPSMGLLTPKPVGQPLPTSIPSQIPFPLPPPPLPSIPPQHCPPPLPMPGEVPPPPSISPTSQIAHKSQVVASAPGSSSSEAPEEAKSNLPQDPVQSEAEKWQEAQEESEIARRAKTMSQMSLAMYEFTRGEGELKTTQELFTQAEFFAEEANKLYKIVRHFTYQVPSGDLKTDLLLTLDQIPTYVQQLQFTVKNPTVGKAATFTKVDNVIQETKHLVEVVSRVVNLCMQCAKQYNLDLAQPKIRSRTLSPSCREDGEGGLGGLGSSPGTSSSDQNLAAARRRRAPTGEADARRTRVSFLLF